ncbi:MAG: outer membrane beta-barrel protein [Pseudomonadota bacterium]
MTHRILTALAAATALTTAAHAQETPYYLKLSGGALYTGDSTNSGRAEAPFEPGLVDAVLVEGGAYRFETDFETGGFAGIAIGKTTPYGPFRSELELLGTTTDVARHGGFETLGQDLDNADLAVLLGQDTPTGTTIGTALADARGSVETVSIMINFYHDLRAAGAIYPYWGAGIGPTWVNVSYDPSGTGFVDDDSIVFSWQAMAGVAWELNNQHTIQVGSRYLGMQTVEVDTSAFLESELDVDVRQFLVELGWRYRF